MTHVFAQFAIQILIKKRQLPSSFPFYEERELTALQLENFSV